MTTNFKVILADPPWAYRNYAYVDAVRGCRKEYQTMSVEEICALPIRDIAAVDCALFLWVTFPLLFDSKPVLDAWGFDYKSVAFVWFKANRGTEIGQGLFFAEEPEKFWGMGNWTRSNTEICLLATRGKPERQSASVHQVVYAPISKHSEKPEEVRNRIVQLCGDVPRIELFARRRAPGWHVFGNEVESDVVLAPQK